jgi:cytochrome c553
MVSVATSLNDKQVAALAAYFASLPKPGTKK